MILQRTDNSAFRNCSQHFKYKEFFCKCGLCQKQIIDEELVFRLEQIRRDVGKSVLINSAYRCERHNNIVGGKKNSTHLEGKAADIMVVGVKPWELAKIAIKAGFDAIGVAKGFLHVDVRHDKHRFWVYDFVKLDQVKSLLAEELKTWNL